VELEHRFERNSDAIGARPLGESERFFQLTDSAMSVWRTYRTSQHSVISENVVHHLKITDTERLDSTACLTPRAVRDFDSHWYAQSAARFVAESQQPKVVRDSSDGRRCPVVLLHSFTGNLWPAQRIVSREKFRNPEIHWRSTNLREAGVSHQQLTVQQECLHCFIFEADSAPAPHPSHTAIADDDGVLGRDCPRD
jgi:hypothetical protein